MIYKELNFKDSAIVHSSKKPETVQFIAKVGDNDYIVETQSGIKCHAIFNPFSGWYYADDLYRIVKEDE